MTQRVAVGGVADDVALVPILGASPAQVGKVEVEEEEPGEEDRESQGQQVHHPAGDDAVEPFLLEVLVERLEPRVEVAYPHAAADLALEEAVAVGAAHGARLVLVLLLVFLLDHGRKLRVVVLVHAPGGVQELAQRRHRAGASGSNVNVNGHPRLWLFESSGRGARRPARFSARKPPPSLGSRPSRVNDSRRRTG